MKKEIYNNTMENSNPLIFIPGMMAKKPHEKAPPSIKLNLYVKSKEFFTFAKEHTNERGWLNIDIRWSDTKKQHYLTLNTYEGNGGNTEKKGDNWKEVNAYREQENLRARKAVGDVDPAVEASGEPEAINPNDIPF